MSLGLLYWILILFWLLFGVRFVWTSPPDQRYQFVGNNILLFVLLLILGIKAFGWPIKG